MWIIFIYLLNGEHTLQNYIIELQTKFPNQKIRSIFSILRNLFNKTKNGKSKRRFWMHSIFKRREQLGEFQSLVKELSSHEDKFFQYFLMPQPHFNMLLELVALTRHYEEGHHIQKKYIFP